METLAPYIYVKNYCQDPPEGGDGEVFAGTRPALLGGLVRGGWETRKKRTIKSFCPWMGGGGVLAPALNIVMLVIGR